MGIDPIKPIGAFIENTIRPLLEEFRWFFEECDKREIPINEKNIKDMADYIARAHFRTVMVQFVQAIILALIAGGVWILLKA